MEFIISQGKVNPEQDKKPKVRIQAVQNHLIAKHFVIRPKQHDPKHKKDDKLKRPGDLKAEMGPLRERWVFVGECQQKVGDGDEG